jgi:hypothetical protein
MPEPELLLNGSPDLPIVTTQARDLIKQLLCKNMKDRISLLDA